MHTRTIIALSSLCLVWCTGSLPAQAKSFAEMFPGVSYENKEAQDLIDTFDYRQGNIELAGVGAKLSVPVDFYFLGSKDAGKVITEIWGNPPSTAESVLGMILPAAKSPVDDTWGAIVAYDEDGYVSDADAEKINYDELLASMQESTQETSKERVEGGYPSIRLLGRASPPFFDREAHKLHWAKDLEFGGNAEHTLNYDVRALGRRGVLRINFVSDMAQLAEIKSVIPAVLKMPEFDSGARYGDFVPGADKVAAYGIGGLIAGKALSKAGLLAVLLVFLKKGWILILMALAGAAKFVGRAFGRKAE